MARAATRTDSAPQAAGAHAPAAVHALRCAALAVAALALASCGRDRAGMPDVLLVSLDTLRADRLSCYGHTRRTTPNLDALAARGLRFADAIAPSIHTAPSHMSVLTGMLPFAHGVFNRDLSSPTVLALDAGVPTLPQLLGEAGWSTAAVVQEGQLLPEIGFARGFDAVDFTHDSFLGRIAALDGYLTGADPEAPQFVFVHTYEPHAPYLPPRVHDFTPFYGRFTDATYDGPFRAATEALLDGPPGAKIGAPQFGAVREPFPEDVQFLSDLYDENVAWTDHLVGELLETWGRHRDLDQTLVVVFSDHGEAFYEHGRFGHDEGLYRELVHVPLIVAGPGIEPGVVEETVGLLGLGAGLLHLLDVDVPGTMAPPIARLAGRADEHETVDLQLYQRSRDRVSLGALDAREHYTSETDHLGTVERLYERRDDPRQQRDLAPGAPARLEPWRARVERVKAASLVLAQRYPVLATGEGADDERLRQLRALGYGE
jgi:arylsulfatase A-like enzyme